MDFFGLHFSQLSVLIISDKDRNRPAKRCQVIGYVKFFSCLICALNPDYVKKHSQKGKNCSSWLEPQKIALDAKSSSNVAECKRERPMSAFLGEGTYLSVGAVSVIRLNQFGSDSFAINQDTSAFKYFM